MKKIILFICAALVLFAACKKDDDNNNNGGSPAGSTRRDTLVAGKWLTVSVKARTNFLGKDSTFDLFATADSCDMDNLTIFKADSNLVMDEGPTKCNASTPQQRTEGSWKLGAGNSQLILNTGGQSLDGAFQITSFSDSLMRVERDSTIYGITGHLSVTYLHRK